MRKQLALIFTLVGLAGCTTVPHGAGFGDVEKQVRERIGLRVRWDEGAAQDDEVRQSVKDMLRDLLTAERAVQIALLNNRRLQAIYEELAVSRAQLIQAGLLDNPVFDAAAKFPLSGGQVELEFNIAQEFLGIFFIPLRQRIARADFEQAKLSVTARVMDVAAQTLAAFYRAQAAEQILEMHGQVVRATIASYELARRLREADNITDLEFLNERALHEQAKLDYTAAEAHDAESRESLNTLLGLWGEETAWKISPRLPEIPQLTAELAELEDIEKQAVASSLELAIARQQIVALGQQLGLTRAAYLLPVAEVGVGAERQEGEWEVGPSISLPVPLFDLGHARIAGANAQARRANQEYYALAVEVRSAARAARQRLLTTQRTAAHYRDVMLPLRGDLVQQTQLQYNAMQVGGFELLLAKQRQIETGRRYIEAAREYWLARVQFEQIRLGRMTDVGRQRFEPRLALPDEAPGDPEPHD